MLLTFIHDGNSNDDLGSQQKYARSRDCTLVPHNLEIGTQFPDSKNAQCNLEIAQIPKLHGTYILARPHTCSMGFNGPFSVKCILSVC